LSCLIIIRIRIAIAAIKTELGREVPGTPQAVGELFAGAVRWHARKPAPYTHVICDLHT
jgi:hypothetical protein